MDDALDQTGQSFQRVRFLSIISVPVVYAFDALDGVTESAFGNVRVDTGLRHQRTRRAMPKSKPKAKTQATRRRRGRPPGFKPIQRREILPGQLVCTRAQSAHALACSIPTIIRLERAGVLKKFRRNPSKPSSQIVHRVDQVNDLIYGGRGKVKIIT
jgi:hypothetical protein